jgi:threonine dehydrogenase-like Zn-dependent dehydrogenase
MLGVRAFELRELPVPDAPPSGGAIIKVVANGICGSDWDLYSGRMTMPASRPAPFPLIPGHEPVGRIVAIDPVAAQTWGVQEGDRIVVESRVRCGKCRECLEGRGPQCRNAVTYSLVSVEDAPGLWGGMAEYMVLLPQTSVFKVPENLSDPDAALFNPLGNAFNWTLEVGGVGVGDRVLVLGSGQRGLACLVAAREAGAAQVIVTGLSSDRYKLALAPQFGATSTIDVEETDTVEAVRDLTGGEGVDVVVDTVPEAVAPIRHALDVLRVGGRLVLAGVREQRANDFPLDRIRSKQLNLVGVRATTAWSVANALRVLSEGRYPFARLQAYDMHA